MIRGLRLVTFSFFKELFWLTTFYDRGRWYFLWSGDPTFSEIRQFLKIKLKATFLRSWHFLKIKIFRTFRNLGAVLKRSTSHFSWSRFLDFCYRAVLWSCQNFSISFLFFHLELFFRFFEPFKKINSHFIKLYNPSVTKKNIYITLL